MNKLSSKEISQIMIYELNCRIARFERDRDDPEKYGVPDPWSCPPSCKYCGLVDRDHEKVEKAFEEVIRYFRDMPEYEINY